MSLPSTVISVFAILILSVLGSLFARSHHMVMGSDEAPEDGGAVAASIFIAVAVYAVRYIVAKGACEWEY